MDNRQMINSWQTITRGSCVSKAWKPPSSRPILIYFEFRSKPSLITVIWMDPHSPKKFIATKYCFLILGDDTSFFFLIISVFFVFLLFYAILCYFVIISFYKNYFIIIILFYFFSWKLFLFLHVPGYSGIMSSGMFRVPDFIDALCSRKIDDFRKNFDLSWHCVGRLTRPERNLRNLFLGHGLKYINCSNKSIIYIGFLMNNYSKNILFRYYVC